jgi:hypothetical protein
MPTWIWEVTVDNRLFVRAYNGKASKWYQAALVQRAGKILAIVQEFDVVFAATKQYRSSLSFKICFLSDEKALLVTHVRKSPERILRSNNENLHSSDSKMEGNGSGIVTVRLVILYLT